MKSMADTPEDKSMVFIDTRANFERLVSDPGLCMPVEVEARHDEIWAVAVEALGTEDLVAFKLVRIALP